MDHPGPALTARQKLPARSLPPAVRRFLDTESAGGIALVAAALVALVWANSPWRDTYETFWHNPVTLRVGSFGIADDLRHVVNDGLMALFFVVVALEIKRELVTGDLRSPRVAALPAVAALGGMVVPAAIYLAVNPSGDASQGWGIPMATDIAFALGVLALLGSRVPSGLKVFLLSLAIVDDIGAIVVIAVFYTDRLDATALAVALGAVAAAVALRWARVWWHPAYVALGIVCWLATYEAGVHATLAGVAFGLLAPARPIAPVEVARRWAADLSDEPTAGELRQMTTLANETVSVADRVQHNLHPLTSYVVVPIFALANAGVEVTTDAFSPSGAAGVAAGVAVGLVVGKVVGITAASALAVRLRLGSLPPGASWSQLVGVAAVAGIGFTVSLFITGLAFDDPHLQDAARLAVLGASLVASGLGALFLLRAKGPAEPEAGTGSPS
ncbi:MAG TPA: Na+/H+ antiporter NhaA [Acidimicrobiales bacterium]